MRGGEFLKRISRGALDVVFPRVCHVCGRSLSEGEQYVCLPCLSSLPRTGLYQSEQNRMTDLLQGKFSCLRAHGHFSYVAGSDLAELVYDLKYHRFQGLGRYLGRVMALELLTTGFLTGIEVLAPIPMHWYKQASRGYNPAREISLGISAVTGNRVSKSLKARRGHATQTGKAVSERAANIRDVFKVKDTSAFSSKTVLLVDDICTTGATLASAADAITKACVDVKLVFLTLGITK